MTWKAWPRRRPPIAGRWPAAESPERKEIASLVACGNDALAHRQPSLPDPNRRPDPAPIGAVEIVVNTKGQKVKFAVKNLRWVQF